MNHIPFKLLLADDDADDCIFFKEVLEDLPVLTNLTTVNDGVQLMHLLAKIEQALPDALYLDLNMPLKNGFECLKEIKQNPKLKEIPIIIFSTSFDKEVVNLLRELGAAYYIRKPPEYFNLRKIILKSINLIVDEGKEQHLKGKFIITLI